MLLNLRHEVDRVHLMQSALLLTWHVGDGDTVSSGSYFWTGYAVRIGCGMGVHRHNGCLPLKERSLYKRSWWAAFISEVFSSLETGRPCSVRAEDIDQSLLTEEDFSEQSEGTSKAPERNVPLSYHVRMIKLAFIALDVLSLNAPAREHAMDVDAINNRLALWCMDAGLLSGVSQDNKWTPLLRMHYNIVLLHLHRSLISRSGSEIVCSSAAESIVEALERLAILDGLAHCHFTAIGGVTAAGIQLVYELQRAFSIGNMVVAINSMAQLKRTLQCAKDLGQLWPNADAVHQVFAELHTEYELYITQGLQGEDVSVTREQPDWNRLLTDLPSLNIDAPVPNQPWVSQRPWDDRHDLNL